MIDATDETNQNRLHAGEIVADAVGFMFAGHETTSVTLVFATYVLGTHPEVQEKLANEIHDYFEENPVRDSVYYYNYVAINVDVSLAGICTPVLVLLFSYVYS